MIFDLLGSVDRLASPNRSYMYLNENMFNELISDELVDAIASLLYTENSLYPFKIKTKSLLEEYNQFSQMADINMKKQTIINQYITQQQPKSPLSLPAYQLSGYEVIAINSDGNDGVYSEQSPSRLSKTQSQRSNYISYQE